MASQYSVQIDCSDDGEELTRTDIIYSQMTARGRHWPKVIGITEIILGTVMIFLGIAEVIIVPMLESKGNENTILFDKSTCYGCGIYAGLMIILTGSTYLRAFLSQRNSSVYRFYHLIIISLLMNFAFTVLFILAYAKGWTSSDKYPPDSSLPEVHFFLTLFIIFGFLFAMTGFIQYFDVICCGDRPLWIPWVRFISVLCCRSKFLFYHSIKEHEDDRMNRLSAERVE